MSDPKRLKRDARKRSREIAEIKDFLYKEMDEKSRKAASAIKRKLLGILGRMPNECFDNIEALDHDRRVVYIENAIFLFDGSHNTKVIAVKSKGILRFNIDREDTTLPLADESYPALVSDYVARGEEMMSRLTSALDKTNT